MYFQLLKKKQEREELQRQEEEAKAKRIAENLARLDRKTGKTNDAETTLKTSVDTKTTLKTSEDTKTTLKTSDEVKTTLKTSESVWKTNDVKKTSRTTPPVEDGRWVKKSEPKVKLTVVFEYYEAKETYSRIGVLRG